jgi:hypothetical protein
MDAIERGILPFGYRAIPHELCLAREWNKVRAMLGEGKGAASHSIQELKAFYELGAEDLWITFANQRLYWCLAESTVHWVGTESNPPRYRKAIDGWRDTDIRGNPILVDELSTKLTQVRNYRRTVCMVSSQDYLLRRLNCVENPHIRSARDAQAKLCNAAASMITELHWADFEVLADLIFARLGWQRLGVLGGLEPDVDLSLRQPASGERAFVQVKSKANQAVFDECLATFEKSGFDRMFFLCHSPEGDLNAPDRRSDIHLWTGRSLAATAVTAGLIDWLSEKSR